jgi:hypothetical protein
MTQMSEKYSYLLVPVMVASSASKHELYLKQRTISGFSQTQQYTGLFETIVGVFTTCHTQYT